ncbi:MAG: NTP transferase domain-containing protein [Vulcanimicrobiota bacterium]
MLTLVVLAAGMGSRYGGLKQVDPVGPHGEILLEYSVYDALRAGFDRVVCVIRHDLETAFEEHIGSRLRDKVKLEYAYQELSDIPAGCPAQPERSKPWGTGQAIWATRRLIEGPFLAINADDFYGLRSYQLLGQHLSQPQAAYAMAGFRLANTLSEFGSVSRGICELDADGWLQRVVEHTKIERSQQGAISQEAEGGPHNLTGEEVVSMNFWGLQPTIFPELESQFRTFLNSNPGGKGELYIPSVLDRVIREGRGRVQVLTSPESWFGVTYPDDKPRVVEEVRQRIAAGQYPEQLWT